MMHKKNIQKKLPEQESCLFVCFMLVLLLLTGCEASQPEIAAVNYTPLPMDDWELSTLTEEGLDPLQVAELYSNASELKTIYSLLIVKNGKLVAEEYFNEGSVEHQNNMQSATKSYFSALVGIALDQGCLTSVDQKMIDFFPEYADQISDPRKHQITIAHLLQMRSGYPWEESHPDLWDAFFEQGDWLPLIVHFPLTSDPGTEFQYSNFSTYLLGTIVSRACNVDFREFAEQYLFSAMGAELGEMWQDNFGYYYINLHTTARDAARFGQLFLDDGKYEGHQVISTDWVHASLQSYTENPSGPRVGRKFTQTGYGYQWWSAGSGEQDYQLALGHGGQVIALLDDFDMVIVVTADPFFLIHNNSSWRHEKNNINLVADFIASLPDE
jgi:CubicO group peptidase (beta-lactamase class C family)